MNNSQLIVKKGHFRYLEPGRLAECAEALGTQDSSFQLSSLHASYTDAPEGVAGFLIASRIPPGPGGSIARKNDNVFCLGPLEGALDACGVPLGGL